MRTITYSGLLCEHYWGDADDIVFLSSLDDPLALELLAEIADRQVTARYWITDKQVTKEEAQENFVRQLVGAANCEFDSRYSEYTGYLWTDEKCKIGGHDLMNELRGQIGKWLILEIDIHEP